MKKPISSKVSTTLFVAGSILLGYFILFLPITRQLDNALIEKWQLSAQAKSYSLQLVLQQSVEAGNSISSRSAIRDKLCDYKNGLTTWDELRDYTQQKYNDGVSILDNIVFAYRLIDQQLLVSYQTPGMESVFDEFHKHSLSLNKNQILYLNEKVYFLVISEIAKNDECLGKDILLFDISPIIENLNADTFLVKILSLGMESNTLQNNPHPSTSKNMISYEETLPDVDAYVRIETQQQNVLGDASNITVRYLFLYIFLIILLYWLANRLFVRQTRHVINKIEDSKQDFMEMAFKDALTNAFSRQFLVNWIAQAEEQETSENNPRILVLLDIDDMKSINDTYGHEIGDLVLKKVVEVIYKMIRKDDLIIRFGGDEFLIIFDRIDENIVSSIMNRIEAEIKTVDIWSIQIDISYGISSIQSIEMIDEAIKDADMKMYQVKNLKPSRNN
jgi:diguanylate cyclase (GGDEF)-like protein